MRANTIRSVACMILLVAASRLQAETLTWTAATGDWFNAANWTNWGDPENTRVPAAGDAAVVSNAGASVVLTGSTPWLASVLISNATLSFSNWDTRLTASNVTLRNKGVLTCFGPFTNNAMSNRVYLSCAALEIQAGGAINVNG